MPSFGLFSGSVNLSSLLEEGSHYTHGKANEDRFNLVLRWVPSIFATLNWREPLNIRETADADSQSIFTGVVTSANLEGERVILSGSGLIETMGQARTGGAWGADIRPEEIIFYTVKAFMPEHVDPSGIVSFDGQGTLGDKKTLFRMRPMVYVVPVLQLESLPEELAIGDGFLYDWTQEPNHDDNMIRSSFKEDLPAEWKHPVRLRMYIEAKDMVEAFDVGRERSDEILDIIAMGLNRTSITTRTGFTWKTFDRKANGLNTNRAQWAYVRDIHIRVRRYWTRWFDDHLRSGESSSVKYLNGNQVFDRLSEIASVTREHRSHDAVKALRAIHALRQAYEAPNAVDGIHHLNRAMEHLVYSEATVPRLAPKKLQKLRREVKKIAKTTLEETVLPGLVAGGANDFAVNQLVDEIADLVGSLNRPPLRKQWEALLVRVGVRLSEEESEFLWRMRKQRNLDTHGNVAVASREDVLRAYSTVEKVILALVEAVVTQTTPWLDPANRPV